MSNPAGWYQQPDGHPRYWDGEKWTQDVAPAAAATAASTPAGSQPPGQGENQPPSQGENQPPGDGENQPPGDGGDGQPPGDGENGGEPGKPWYKSKHVIGYACTAIAALAIGILLATSTRSTENTGPASQQLPVPTLTATVTTPGPASTTTTTVSGPTVTHQVPPTTVTTTTTKTVTSTVTSGPPPAAAPAAGSIPGDGTFQVGVDVQPGTYVSAPPDSGNCYWARLSGNTGSLGSIIANNNSSGQSVVTIRPSDKFFESTGCLQWARR